ncbi:glycosyltransferase family 4 protein [Geobacter sp. SVR]|uniref:glycosyltransferase family 4 protein n=1 Tax=Geobacter sp. SVR TaxID=2495594 RepID=UPI00156415B9|nr:glycosyltransferase family 4 protein [Geobacter sp. SVR]
MDVPEIYPRKNRTGRLKVLYVGRGSEEKRVHLAGKAAAVCARQEMPVDFVFVGNVEHAIAREDRHWCRFMGELANPSEMAALYASADVLVLTSSREGFPMAVMEAMAHGMVPVVTPVGGIPDHVRNGENGILLSHDESQLPAEIAARLSELCASPDLLDLISRNAYDYAASSFSRSRFCGAYRELFGC